MVIRNERELGEFTARAERLYLEIGMGKGSFIVNNALAYPENSYIGIEKYASVALRAVELSDSLILNENAVLDNLGFMCIDARLLREYFKEDSLDGIYLNFSDPWPKKRQINRRLTYDTYIRIYKELLKPNGFIEQKTDNRDLFDYSVSQLIHSGFRAEYISYDLYSEDELLSENIPTEYETKFHTLGNKIFKARFIL